MKERIVSTFLILLLASPFCYASGYTLAVANHIIVILVIIVIALVVMGSYILRNNWIFRQRNEQLRRILTALDDYRAIVGNEALSLDEHAEYAAKILMEHPDHSAEDIASQCGFKNTAAYISTFKFAFGIAPSDYLSGISQMFKKKQKA